MLDGGRLQLITLASTGSAWIRICPSRVPDAGHLVNMEQPTVVNDLLLRFLHAHS